MFPIMASKKTCGYKNFSVTLPLVRIVIVVCYEQCNWAL